MSKSHRRHGDHDRSRESLTQPWKLAKTPEEIEYWTSHTPVEPTSISVEQDEYSDRNNSVSGLYMDGQPNLLTMKSNTTETKQEVEQEAKADLQAWSKGAT